MPIYGNIEVYYGPKPIGAPDDLEAVIVRFIDGAKKRLEIAVQELENETIARAVIRARQRKIIVKLVLEQGYLREVRISRTPWAKINGGNEQNRIIHDAILRANIDVKTDYNTKIFHQKFIIRDRRSVLTGSTNFTPTGTHRNLNHVVIVHDKKVARHYYREFKEIQQGRFGKYSVNNDVAPPTVMVSDVRVKVMFAPDHNPEMEIMKQMLKARKRIDFAIFTFAQSSGIDDTMFRLLDLGMPIRGAFDGRQGARDWSASHALKNRGAELYAVQASRAQNGVGKLHHKLMVIDDQVVIAGSFNYTAPANRLNDENIIILGDLDARSAVEQQAQTALATAARAEIDRIITAHGRPM